MSLLARIFGKKKSNEPITTGDAIKKLRVAEEMLIKKQEFFKKKIEKEIATTRANVTKNKGAALQALKFKKMYAKILQQIDETLSKIESQKKILEKAANVNMDKIQNQKFKAKAKKHNIPYISKDIFKPSK